jgi:hypothetical protein
LHRCSLAVSSAELNEGWIDAVGGVGVLVCDDKTFGGLVQLEPPMKGDFRCLEMVSAPKSGLEEAGWHTTELSIKPFLSLVPGEPMPVRRDELAQDLESGLFLAYVRDFSKLWTVAGLVFMPIECTGSFDDIAEHKDPHIALVREVMDTSAGTSDHGGTVLASELLSRYFVKCGAMSMLFACCLPCPVRRFVHACLGGLEDITPDPLQVDKVRAAKLLLSEHAQHNVPRLSAKLTRSG